LTQKQGEYQVAGKFLSSVGRVFGIQSEHDANDLDSSMAKNDRAAEEAEAPTVEETVLSPKLQLRQEKLQEIRSNMAEFENSVNAAKDLSSFSNIGLSSAKSMLKDVELDLDNQIRVEGENRLLKKQLSEFEQRTHLLESELSQKIAIADSAHTRLSERQEENQLLKDRFIEEQSKSEEQKLIIEQMIKTQSQLESENNHRKQLIDQFEGELLTLNETVENLQAHLSSTQEAAIGFEKEANEWKRVKENTDARLETTQQDLQALRSAHTSLQRLKIDLESKLEVVKAEAQAESRRFNDQMRNKNSKVYSLESKNELLEANARVMTQKTDAISQDNSELKKANSLLEKQIEALKVTVENTRKSHELDRDALYKSGDRMSEMDLKITATIAELDQSNAEKQALTDMVEELSKKNSDLSEKIIRLSAIEEKHEQLVRAIRDKGETIANAKKQTKDSKNVVAMKPNRSA